MSLQALANNMASRGRGPDTMLVHMAPSEVKGLQALAMAHGGSLTINPQTGLPEAGFLSSILPMIAGAFLGPAGAGIFGSAMTAGLGVGAATGLATGSLRKGLMAGLGAYGGSGLMSSVMGAGAGAQGAAAAQAAPAFDYAGIAGTPPIQGIPANIPAVPDAGIFQSAAGAQAAPPMSAEVQNLLSRYPAPATPPVEVAAPTPITPPPSAVSASAVPDAEFLQSAAGAQTAPPPMSRSFPQQVGGMFDQFKAGIGAIGKDPSAFFNKENLKYGLAAAAPLLMAEPKSKKRPSDSEQARYSYDPGRTEEPLGGPYMGERTYFRPAYTRLAADGGTMSSEYDYVYDPATQLYKRKEEITAPSKSGLGALVDAGMGPDSPMTTGQGDPSHPLYSFMNPIGQAITNAVNSNSLSGGLIPYLTGIGGSMTPVPVENRGTYADYVAAQQAAASQPGYAADQAAAEAAMDAAVNAGESVDSGVAAGPGGESVSDNARGGLTALARGGYSHLGDYSDGGRLLRGPGDGVSDSIPASIADKRPARLADGEFVVPARIVSELGNGSTEAGARKLYAMMDRIQKNRAKTVGKDRVAVNSRSEKLLPA